MQDSSRDLFGPKPAQAPHNLPMGEVFRYSRPYSTTQRTIDGLTNYFWVTETPGSNLPLLESGINPIGKTKAPDGLRIPAILISSSPHRIGSTTTPWQDFFDPDNGHIRYYGDNKKPGADPAKSPGNSVLLAAFRQQDSMDIEVRRNAVPIIFFLRVREGKAVKGRVRFQGFGVVNKAELITQYDQAKDTSFPNYAYDFTVLSLAREAEIFDWRWISDRRNAQYAICETLRFAPKSWTNWISDGRPALSRLKRRVSKLLTVSIAEQTPEPGSKNAHILKDVYEFYESRKHRFEALAARVTQRVLTRQGAKVLDGWVTPRSSDGGADFVARIDLGSGFSTIKQIVYGQAKCESPTGTTSGRDIARTVARLRRGWIGAYVTTAAFSEPVQREIIEDEYPILLIPGGRVALEVAALMRESGCTNVRDFLKQIDEQYDSMVADRRPTELLREPG